MTAINKFSQELKKRLKLDRASEIPAFLGNLSGVVSTGTIGKVYVTLVNGEVLEVYNNKVQNISRLPVLIGYGGGEKLQVIRSRDVFVHAPIPDLPPHGWLHTFPNPDASPIRGEQFLPLLVEPYAGLVVYIHGGYYELADGWHAIPTQTLDLTSYVPAGGALFARIEVDNTGAISVSSGTAVSSRAVLEYSDIPAADADKSSLAAVKLYDGQDEILFQTADTDIIDLRWGRRLGGGTPGGSDTQVQYNNGGAFGGDAEFTWDDITKTLGIGDPSILPSVSPDHTFWLVGDGISPSQFMAAYGSSFAPYMAFLKADGSAASPTNVKDDQVIGRIRGRGYDGSGWTDTRLEIRFVADGDWGSGDTPTRIELWTCPDGSSTLTLAMTIGSDGHINIASGKEYRVNGTQHQHDGWLSYATVIPTRASSDDPTYTLQFAGVDLTSTLQEGMPIKWTQNSIVRYGWISSTPAYASSNTTVTVLTRTDSSSTNYDVLDTGTYPITNFAYGLPRQPGIGFPALHEYWDVKFEDTSERSISTPGTGIVNPGSLSQSIPIGDWDIEAEFIVRVEYSGTNTRHSVLGGLGTTSSSFLADCTFYFLATSTDIIANGGYTIKTERHYTTKTTLYINCQCATTSPSTTAIKIMGNTRTTQLIAKCRYL